mgnify:FL=1
MVVFFKDLGISYTMRKQDFLVLLGERKNMQYEEL